MWCGSRCSRWIVRGACVCRCAMWTPHRSGWIALAAALGAAASALSGPQAPASGQTAAGGKIPTGVDTLASADGQYPDWLDRAVPPQVDFFRYANGGWINANPLPPDRSYWGVDTLLEQKNQAFIRDLLMSLPRDGSAGGVQRKLADFYASGMDEQGIEAAGIAPLQAELDRIAAVANTDELQAEFARLQLIGVAAPLQFGHMQDFKDS